MSNKKVARRYSLALFELTEEMKLTAKVVKDFNDIVKSAEKSKELKNFLKTPVINSNRKGKILESLFKGKVQDLTMRFIALLTKKGREDYLFDIAKDFVQFVNEKRGIVEAKIKTAVQITDKEKKLLTQKLSAFTGKEILADFTVDKSIQGGFVAQVKDSIIDASIARQLQLLREQFIKGSFRN